MPTAARPASGSHQRLWERSVFACAASTGRPASRTVVPSGGPGPPGGLICVRMSSIRSCWSERDWTLMPKATSAVSPIGVPPEGLHSP